MRWRTRAKVHSLEGLTYERQFRDRWPGLSAPVHFVSTPGGLVWGLPYPLPLRKLVRRDRNEGRPYGYPRTEVGVGVGVFE